MRPLRVMARPVLVVLALLALASPARARSAGLAALGCDGCHGGGKPATVTLKAEPANAGVGEPITLTIEISQANGASAGFYLTTAFESAGTFLQAEAGTALDSSGVLQTSPRVGTGASTKFTARWAATRPTGVVFDVFALSANGDRTNRGDGAGAATLSLAVGCDGQPHYIDQDGDGFGSDDPAFRVRVDCAPPAGYAAKAGDCDDFRSDVFGGAPELCDVRDNDCNGEVDDDVVNQDFCEDRDGDGHGVVGKATKQDCKPTPGYGACDGDCDDGDPRFHPSAEEVCDLRDNDCDGEVDEDVRTVCGVGLCARRAAGCAPADCTPGEPLPETCNGYDDDCDGVVDNGDVAALCGDSGSRCFGGRCSEGGSAGSAGSAGASVGGGAGVGTPQEPSAEKPGAPGCDVNVRTSTGQGAWGLALSALAALVSHRARRALRVRAIRNRSV